MNLHHASRCCPATVVFVLHDTQGNNVPDMLQQEISSWLGPLPQQPAPTSAVASNDSMITGTRHG
jgi:hypothetical protein